MTISHEYAEELGRQIDELEAENERLRSLIQTEPQAAPEITEKEVLDWLSRNCTAYSLTRPQSETERDLREQNLRGLLREARDYVEVADTDHSASLLNDINDTLALSRPKHET